MERIDRLLKPLANFYTILLIWSLTIVNFYLCVKPVSDYATAAGLNSSVTILDAMNYYTAEEGYQTLTNLGPNGRNAYRLTNYIDFIFPFFLFLSLSLPNIALGRNYYCSLIYMIFDYIENLAEKYVLEIYPNRNDFVMTLACYAGLIKITAFYVSLIIVFINLFKARRTKKNKDI